MIVAQNISKGFGPHPNKKLILTDISLKIQPSSCTLITGVSGSGKSTLFALLGGLEAPTAGSIYWHGKNISTFSQKEHEYFLSTQCGYLFQFPYLIPELSILENCCIKELCQGKSKKQFEEKGLEMLHLMGIANKAHCTPEQLSGGEQQRVALARALFNKPAFLLADEPFAHLDTFNAQLIMNLIKQYQHDYGLGVILSSHPHHILSENQQFFHQHFELKNGTLIPSA